MSILEIKDLSKSFYLHNFKRTINSCKDISFNLERGEFIGIIGRSGAGKSTILKCINRTYIPGNGEIWYESLAFGRVNLGQISEREMIYLRKKEIGYVSQFLHVMPRTTAKEHVMSALLEMGIESNNALKETEEMLSFFNLPENLWDLYPHTFSGGEFLRLNLAHAMVKKPVLLLLDEPTASLDNKTKELVKDIIIKLKEKKSSMLGIFHDLEFMEGVCDKVFNISDGRFL